MTSKPITIFMVEDNEMYSMMLDHKLKQVYNFNLCIYKSGEECLSNLNQNPNVVILDYNLTGMNGLMVLKEIKKQNPDIPVIILSGQKDIHVAVECMTSGAYDYIIKDKDTLTRLSKDVDTIISNQEIKTENLTLKLRINKNKILIRSLTLLLILFSIILIIYVFNQS